MIKGIVWDLDNTLFDYMRYKRLAIDAAAEAMIDAGLKIGKNALIEEIYRIYWNPNNTIEDQNVLEKVLQKVNNEINYKYLAAGITGYRASRENNMVTYPHVHFTLTKLLKKGIPMIILSDAPKKEVWLRMYKLRLKFYFEEVITAQDIGVWKPDPKMFQAAQVALNIPFNEILMVGDWESRDIAGARELNMRTAFAKYGDQFSTKTSHADYILTDILDILDVVDQENVPAMPAPPEEMGEVELEKSNQNAET